MLEQRIQTQFFESADLIYQVAEPLSRPLAMAAQMLVDGITGGGRVLCAGLGLAAHDAAYMAALLSGRFEQDRPGLGAIALNGMLHQGSGAQNEIESLERLVMTLGHPGDLLLMLDNPSGSGEALLPVLQAAHEQDLSIIMISGSLDDGLRLGLLDTDVQLRLAHSRFSRVSEGYRLVLHCLCDAIDMQLLGTND